MLFRSLRTLGEVEAGLAPRDPGLGLEDGVGEPTRVVGRCLEEVVRDALGRLRTDARQPTELVDIVPRLKAASAEKPTTVVIAGDETTALQNLVSVLDALKAAGITSAQIVTRAK